jgi:hypothetical protein
MKHSKQHPQTNETKKIAAIKTQSFHNNSYSYFLLHAKVFSAGRMDLNTFLHSCLPFIIWLPAGCALNFRAERKNNQQSSPHITPSMSLLVDALAHMCGYA